MALFIGRNASVSINIGSDQYPVWAPLAIDEQPMTESEWLASSDTGAMLRHLGAKVPSRKYQLYREAIFPATRFPSKLELARNAALLRCIFGNPFSPNPLVEYDFCTLHGWLAWNSGTVPKLAERIYAERRWDEMPVLADALEEAGMTDEEIIRHLRDPGPHARGCFVLDGILGKGHELTTPHSG